MKKILIVLALTTLTACGTDDSSPNNYSGPVVAADANTQAPAAKPVEQKANESNLPVQSEARPATSVLDAPTGNLKTFKLTTQFKVSIRTAQATDYCDTEIESILSEDNLDDVYQWKCHNTFVKLPNERSFQVMTFNTTVLNFVTAEVYQAYLNKDECRVTGEAEMKCRVTDNYFEIYVDSVVNRDEAGKYYSHVTWKVYYNPLYNF